MSKTFVRHPLYGTGWLLKVKKQSGAKVRFLKPTNKKVTRHLADSAIRPLTLREVELLPLAGVDFADVRAALIVFYERQVRILQKAIDETKFKAIPGTLAEKYFRILQDGVAQSEMHLQKRGYGGLIGIARKGARGKQGPLFLPGHTDAVKDTATDIILENLNGTRKDIRWIGRQTRQQMIKKIRTQDKALLVLIGDLPDAGEDGDGLTAEEILSFLADRAHHSPLVELRTDWRVCQGCGKGFHGRSDAKTCSPACRKALSRQKCHTSQGIDN